MFVSTEENDGLREVLEHHHRAFPQERVDSTPRREAEAALEALVKGKVDGESPYEQLSQMIYAFVQGYDESLRVAASHVLALGRYRRQIYDELLTASDDGGSVLEKFERLRPALYDDVDVAVEGMNPNMIECVALYFESRGDFTLAAKAARIAKSSDLVDMYDNLAKLKEKFCCSDIVN